MNTAKEIVWVIELDSVKPTIVRKEKNVAKDYFKVHYINICQAIKWNICLYLNL